uniref:Serpentine Receptor, class H n=1 Tax=Panagrellus redivivus TaxID=6233 RepID=A0A7E4UPD9_PANRE
MGIYKWYLAHQLTWSYLFDVYVGLLKVVPFWPFYLGYSAGIHANLKSNDAAVIQLIPLAFLSVGMGFSIYISVLYRYMQAAPLSIFYRHYSCLYVRIPVYMTIFLGLQALICIPLLFNFPQQDGLKTAMISQYPVLQQIFEDHPSVFGYEASEAVLRYNFTIVYTFVALSVSIVLLYLNFLRILRKNKQHLSIGTYNMQLMLFRTLFIQIFVFVLLLIFPILTAFVLIFIGLRCLSVIGLVALTIVGTHAFFDFCVLTFFIRSYREYVKECFRRVKKKLGFKVATVDVVPLVQNTISDLPSIYH